MKALEDIFFGNNIPYDSPALDPDEHRRLAAGILEVELPLFQSMSKEQKKLYDQYVDRCADLTDANERDAFVRGFRLGVQVMLEALTAEKQPAAKK